MTVLYQQIIKTRWGRSLAFKVYTAALCVFV